MNHHAFLAQPTTVTKAVVDCFFDTKEYSDLGFIEVVSFGIDDVRKLTLNAYSTPVSGVKKLLIVLAREITAEAQQALLKILEEPPQTTVFLFVLPKGTYLLPTLLSRFYKLNQQKADANEVTVFQDFMNMNMVTRMATITKKLDDKDSVWIEGIKSGLLDYLDKNSVELVKNQKLPGLMFVADYLLTRGASNKQLLEELALTLG